MCVRIFGTHENATDDELAAAITNGTAPGLYVREGDDTSDWETYRQVLARRVEEAMAARRRGGEGGIGAGETTPAVLRRFAPSFRILNRDGKFIPIDDGPGYTLDYDGQQMWANFGMRRELSPRVSLSTCEANVASGHYIELPLGSGAVRTNTSTTRQDDEIRVGDVVEVVSCSNTLYTRRHDIGSGGRVIRRYRHSVQLTPVDSMRLPSGGIAAVADVRKVASPSLSPQTVAANISPMPDEEASRIEAAVSDEVRRRISSPLVSDETTRQRVVNPSPPPPPTPPSPPSRFSLLEIDTDAASSLPQAPKASTGLAALQQELRAEREARRALAAAQTPPGRFDLLECDLPAAVVKTSTKATKTPQARPAASPPPPRRPVETITDLTTARSPLELARMLEGLNDELSTMMRQREAN